MGVKQSADRRPNVIAALDFPSAERALGLVDELGDLCRFYKVGSELFTAAGPSVVRELRERGCEVMLDLKFHDIPNTVRGASSAAAALGVRLLTVHAFAGTEVLQACVAGAGTGCKVLAVTVLTSVPAVVRGRAQGQAPVAFVNEVLRLAAVAFDAGAHGVVCSGYEASAVRERFGTEFEILVPGLRPQATSFDDQARVVTPAEAVRAGANYLVVGRAITGDQDPPGALRRILAEVEGAGKRT